MIAMLTGVVADATADTVVLNVAGVGYLLHVADSAGLPMGSEHTVHTSMVVREDSMTLYGFETGQQRDLFSMLCSASGVGPKTALHALRTLPAPTLTAAVATRDLATLSTIPGIGKKSAEKLCLELGDKVAAAFAVNVDGAVAAAATEAFASTAQQQAHAALLGLGYSPTEASAALRDVVEDDVSKAIRAALRKLSTGISGTRR
jgi:Holliday junction DNA helicase RuvA